MHNNCIVTTDQMNQTITLPQVPQRIISLVPSQTELLHYLGLGDRVVGITKFCVHPNEWYRNKPRIGGTKTLNFEKIIALQPDLIIGNKEENTQAEIEFLQKNYPVWMSDLYTLDDVWDMFSRLGKLLQVEKQATALTSDLKQRFSALKKPLQAPKVAYFIWQKPYMVAGSNTFIDHILQQAGFENVFATQQRYPSCGIEEIQAARPDYILLSSEPYPFKEKHIQHFQSICPNAVIEIVDGELFSWYGSRLLHTVDYIQILHQKMNVIFDQ